ncbi:MAG: phosphatase PAP2 family protein [bacterium]|nr:MAG: phosphatase PAP2 family protein [bacterium]
MGSTAGVPRVDPLSFPSGHTTSAFSTVPVIWHHLGWQAGVGASVLAVSTGFGRMEENRHYLSDILVGAAIGLVVGKAVIGQRYRDGWLDHVVVSGRQMGFAWNF